MLTFRVNTATTAPSKPRFSDVKPRRGRRNNRPCRFRDAPPVSSHEEFPSLVSTAAKTESKKPEPAKMVPQERPMRMPASVPVIPVPAKPVPAKPVTVKIVRLHGNQPEPPKAAWVSWNDSAEARLRARGIPLWSDDPENM